MTDKFALKWNDFHSNVAKSFQNLRKEEDFYDVTLVSDDQKQISAHKIVLSSCSEYFNYILKQNKQHIHPLLCLEGIGFNELNSVLDYIYHGEVKLHQDDLDKFLRIAQRLKLEGLIGGENNTEDKDRLEEEYVAQYDNEKVLEVTESKIISKPERSTYLNSESFQNLEDLDARVLEVIERDADGTWMCTFCGKKSKQKGHLKEHAEIHFEGLSFPCPACDYICRSRNSLRQHRYKHKNI